VLAGNRYEAVSPEWTGDRQAAVGGKTLTVDDDVAWVGSHGAGVRCVLVAYLNGLGRRQTQRPAFLWAGASHHCTDW